MQNQKAAKDLTDKELMAEIQMSGAAGDPQRFANLKLEYSARKSLNKPMTSKIILVFVGTVVCLYLSLQKSSAFDTKLSKPAAFLIAIAIPAFIGFLISIQMKRNRADQIKQKGEGKIGEDLSTKDKSFDLQHEEIKKLIKTINPADDPETYHRLGAADRPRMRNLSEYIVNPHPFGYLYSHLSDSTLQAMLQKLSKDKSPEAYSVLRLELASRSSQLSSLQKLKIISVSLVSAAVVVTFLCLSYNSLSVKMLSAIFFAIFAACAYLFSRAIQYAKIARVRNRGQKLSGLQFPHDLSSFDLNKQDWKMLFELTLYHVRNGISPKFANYNIKRRSDPITYGVIAVVSIYVMVHIVTEEAKPKTKKPSIAAHVIQRDDEESLDMTTDKDGRIRYWRIITYKTQDDKGKIIVNRNRQEIMKGQYEFIADPKNARR